MSLAVKTFLFACAVTFSGCQTAVGLTPESPTASMDPSAQSYIAKPLPRALVTLPDAFGAQHSVEVEVADSPNTRTRGLMWRKSLADGKGMLFIFPEEAVQSFWMRNTLIALDMVFINRAHRVAGIVEHALPQTLDPRTVGRPSVYVLEVPGGYCARMGIRAGVTVTFQGLPPNAPTE